VDARQAHQGALAAYLGRARAAQLRPRTGTRRGRGVARRERVEELVRREMGAAEQLSVPLEVSVGYGRSWDDAAH
jgi:hypothetical protein